MTWPRLRPVVWLIAALAVTTLAIAPALFEGNPPAAPSAGADDEGYSAGPNGDVRAVQVVRKDRDQSVDQVLKHRLPVAVVALAALAVAGLTCGRRAPGPKPQRGGTTYSWPYAGRAPPLLLTPRA